MRVGLIKGNGEPIQTGGNKVSDDVSFGLPMTKLIVGSHYNLGLIYEALVNLTPVTPSDGHHITIQITPGDVVAILEGYKDYLDDSKKVLADGLVMSFNQG